MGKRIIQQRRGRGSPTYRVPEKAFRPRLAYHNKAGTVVDIVANPLMDAPLAKVRYADQTSGYVIAPSGIQTGQPISDHILPLATIKEGTQIFGIETYPQSGPKLCRSPGAFGVLVSKGRQTGVVQLPSKKTVTLHLSCRATLGTPAGDGRTEKPFVKAGTKWHVMHARGKLYPRTKGNRMNIVDHPFGGSGHGKRRPPVSRHAPPGRKVGTVGARRTGKKK